MPIIWQPAMSVGTKAIDDEHKYLFALFNCVELALKNGDMDSIKLFVNQLTEYCREHFTHEEKLQLRIKYPYYLENKTQHIQILEHLETLQQRFEIEATADQAVAAELKDYDPESDVKVDSAPEVVPQGKIAQMDEALVAEISALLRNWILEHVLVIDRKMHPFLTRLSPAKLKEIL